MSDPLILGLLNPDDPNKINETWRAILALTDKLAHRLTYGLQENDIDDIIQEALKRIIRLPPERLRAIDNLAAYMRTVVRRCAIDSALRRRPEIFYEDLLSEDDSGKRVSFETTYCPKKVTTLSKEELAEIVSAVLSEYPKERAEVFCLYIQCCTQKEIAEATGYPISTVNNWILRIRKHLQEKIREALD